MSEKKPQLKRELSFLHMISIASGAVIGGWLAEAPYWFSVTGAGGALVFPVLAILLIPVGLAFAELSGPCYLSHRPLMYGQPTPWVTGSAGSHNG